MLQERAGSRQAGYRAPADLMEEVELLRLAVAGKQNKDRQADLGQFLTPAPIARFMATLFKGQSPTLHILDAGAGVGTLCAACVAELCARAREQRPLEISVTAYEIDPFLSDYLRQTLHLSRQACERVDIAFTGNVVQQDFIEAGVESLQETLFSPHHAQPRFQCAILNPPYKKIQSRSHTRKLLRQAGIETSNLYTAFLALATRLLVPSGELIAITPRSFCNGPYFADFRRQFLREISLQRLHIFESRKQAFREDNVLQENIILHALKETKKTEKVLISSSAAPGDEPALTNEVAYQQVVHPNDPQAFIRFVQDQTGADIAQRMATFQTSLAELDLAVSTGRVVDFRARDFLCSDYAPGTIPLLFPTHIGYGSITWPRLNGKKPNAILDHEQTQTLQVPNEYYVLVKRFTAKEEARRIVAAVYDPRTVPESTVGFENHLNYFHQNGRGLDPLLARGLTAYLNSTLVDLFFRQFSGHTQVNATDLRNINYPTRDQLEALGKHIGETFPGQDKLDELIQKKLFNGEIVYNRVV